MKQIQENLMEFIENDEFNDLIYQNLLIFIDNQKICENKHLFKTFLHLLSKISDHHYQLCKNFFSKIEFILKSFENEIKNSFSNYDIFNIFKNNKRILLYLFEEKIIIPDKSISTLILSKKYQERYYPDYFFKEFKIFYDELMIKRINRRTAEISENNIDQFEMKRKKGENDQFICELIRNDLIDDFISHVSHFDISLTMKIENSIYETNSFLLDKNPTLIEYAAFFGSVNIFKYLFLNKVNLTSSLWIYAIHNNNSEIIHILEENDVSSIDKSYYDCFKEAIKCHYNDLARYIKNSFLISDNNQDLFILTNCLKFYNFISFAEYETNDYLDNFESKSIFFYDMCKYDHYEIVDFLIKDTALDINDKKILNEINFF